MKTLINNRLNPLTQAFLLVLLTLLTTTVGFAQQLSHGNRPAGSGGFALGIMAGPGLLLEKPPDSLPAGIDDYFNKLRSGWQYGFETQYFINPYFGLGIKYGRFNTRQDADSLVLNLFSTVYYIDLSNNMSIHTVSTLVYGRLPLFKNQVSVTGGIGPAWLFYRNIGKAVNDSAMFKGSSPGLSTTLCVGYQIIPHLSIVLQGHYIQAYLKKITQDDGTTQKVLKLEKADYQNISRMDFSLGVIYAIR